MSQPSSRCEFSEAANADPHAEAIRAVNHRVASYTEKRPPGDDTAVVGYGHKETVASCCSNYRYHGEVAYNCSYRSDPANPCDNYSRVESPGMYRNVPVVLVAVRYDCGPIGNH